MSAKLRTRRIRSSGFIEVERPRCGVCRSDRLRSTRSDRQADGSVWRHARCLDCERRWVVILK